VKKLIPLACAILIVVLSGCPQDTEVEPTPQETVLIDVGDTAPSFELVTLDGETFNLEAHRGKVVLINFFATWCPPCREELPYLEKDIWQRFDRDRLSVLVIGREEDDEIIQPFVDKHGYTVPFAGDPEMVAYSQYATRFIPRNFVIGPDGTILFQSQGCERHDFDRMIEIIEQAVDAIGVTHGPLSPDIPEVPVETEAG
jgi:peroxiredoxin